MIPGTSTQNGRIALAFIPHWSSPDSQKNGKEQQIPMLPGLAELLQRVPEDRRVGWVVNPMPIEYEMESQRTGWFMPAGADLEHLTSTYSNSAIARACGVSETTVRKWLRKLGLPNRGKAGAKAAKVPTDEVAVLEARDRETAYPSGPPRQRPVDHRAGEPNHLQDWQGGQRRRSEDG